MINTTLLMKPSGLDHSERALCIRSCRTRKGRRKLTPPCRLQAPLGVYKASVEETGEVSNRNSFTPCLQRCSTVSRFLSCARGCMLTRLRCTVRLGSSGLKVSRIILGCMSYGDPNWEKWVLGEEEGMKHIKFACVVCACQGIDLVLTLPASGALCRYDHGITTFDTADVSTLLHATF